MSCASECEPDYETLCVKKCIIKREKNPLLNLIPADILFVDSITEACADVIIIVGPEVPCELEALFFMQRRIDKAFEKCITLFKPCNYPLPIIYSPLVEVTAYHDVRVYHDAAFEAFRRMLYAGFESPLLMIPRCPVYANGGIVTILGALEALYVPLKMREETGIERFSLINKLWIKPVDTTMTPCLCDEVSTLEPGRYVYRDIAMADPEHMTSIKIEDYLYELFKASPILIEVICERLVILKQFPLFHAVMRGNFMVPRYQSRIMLLEYIPPCDPLKTIMIVGKGVSFDTGGLTLKIGGSSGQSRDKSGAAAAVGFLQIANIVKPWFIHVIIGLPLTRNAVGECAYAADEIVVARSGVHVRFNNTDAEGRLAMSDTLTLFKELVISRSLPDAHLFTFGTLTHHARIAVGNGYPIIVENSVAREIDHQYHLKTCGTAFGEPHELYLLRKDDFDTNLGKVMGEDFIQKECCTHKLTNRAHQIAGAFLIQSTRLTEHEVTSCFPIKYTHIDMSGNALNFPDIPASQPIIGLVKTHLFKYTV